MFQHVTCELYFMNVFLPLKGRGGWEHIKLCISPFSLGVVHGGAVPVEQRFDQGPSCCAHSFSGVRASIPFAVHCCYFIFSGNSVHILVATLGSVVYVFTATVGRSLSGRFVYLASAVVARAAETFEPAGASSF